MMMTSQVTIGHNSNLDEQ